MGLRIKPITIRDADKFVTAHHRHNKAAGNGKFAIAAYEGNVMVGVAIAGRPRSRHLDNGITLEVYRVCTNGHPNSGSFLYARVKRIGQLMGYEKTITYTLQAESGVTMLALGAKMDLRKDNVKQWNDHIDPLTGKTLVKRSVQKVGDMPKFRWIL